jgi:hypothetical protein
MNRAAVWCNAVQAMSAWVALTLGGCDSTPTPSGTNSEVVALPRRVAEPRPGLVVERLRYRGDPGRLDAALVPIAESGTDPAEADRWRREGFLVRVIDEDMLAALELDLGSDVIPVRTWHGEATDWRSAARCRLGGGSVILLDGRARRLDDRILSLAVRGWSMPLVDGSGLTIELVPHLQRTVIDPLAPPAPLGEFRGVALLPTIHRVLAPGEVLLLAAVPQRSPSPTVEDAEQSTDDPPTAEDVATDAVSTSGPGSGPDGALPPTLAGCLVGELLAGERGVLLIRGRPHPAFGLPTSESANP